MQYGRSDRWPWHVVAFALLRLWQDDRTLNVLVQQRQQQTRTHTHTQPNIIASKAIELRWEKIVWWCLRLYCKYTYCECHRLPIYAHHCISYIDVCSVLNTWTLSVRTPSACQCRCVCIFVFVIDVSGSLLASVMRPARVRARSMCIRCHVRCEQTGQLSLSLKPPSSHTGLSACNASHCQSHTSNRELH